MQYRVAAWRLRLSGSAARPMARVVVEPDRALLVVDGETLATFATIGELMDMFALRGEDLLPDE